MFVKTEKTVDDIIFLTLRGICVFVACGISILITAKGIIPQKVLHVFSEMVGVGGLIIIVSSPVLMKNYLKQNAKEKNISYGRLSFEELSSATSSVAGRMIGTFVCMVLVSFIIMKIIIYFL